MNRSTTPSRRYVLITPCRDEAAYLQHTIDSIAAQTVPPNRWIVVDDGSTDGTAEILERAAARLPYLTVLTRQNRGVRSVGPGVVEAFYEGLHSCDLNQVDYICKLDGDLELPPRYFERLMERCETNPCIGTISGKLFLRQGDSLVEERCGDENSVGPSKFYRVQCFQDIGGFVRNVGWDGIDGHMCRMKGWLAQSVYEPDLRIIHLRRMGSSQVNFWTGRVRWGRGKYYMGSAPYYICAVAMYRMFERPYIISGIGILWGYVRAMLHGDQRIDDAKYLKHFRRYELESLLKGKRRTMARYHERIQSMRSAQSQSTSKVAAA